jgi:hypothetical protein
MVGRLDTRCVRVFATEWHAEDAMLSYCCQASDATSALDMHDMVSTACAQAPAVAQAASLGFPPIRSQDLAAAAWTIRSGGQTSVTD